MMMGLENPVHILFILAVVLMVFGAKRLPEMGRGLGEGFKGFKEAISGHGQTDAEIAPAPAMAAATAPAPAGVPAAGLAPAPEFTQVSPMEFSSAPAGTTAAEPVREPVEA